MKYFKHINNKVAEIANFSSISTNLTKQFVNTKLYQAEEILCDLDKTCKKDDLEAIVSKRTTSVSFHTTPDQENQLLSSSLLKEKKIEISECELKGKQEGKGIQGKVGISENSVCAFIFGDSNTGIGKSHGAILHSGKEKNSDRAAFAAKLDHVLKGNGLDVVALKQLVAWVKEQSKSEPKAKSETDKKITLDLWKYFLLTVDNCKGWEKNEERKDILRENLNIFCNTAFACEHEVRSYVSGYPTVEPNPVTAVTSNGCGFKGAVVGIEVKFYDSPFQDMYRWITKMPLPSLDNKKKKDVITVYKDPMYWSFNITNEIDPDGKCFDQSSEKIKQDAAVGNLKWYWSCSDDGVVKTTNCYGFVLKTLKDAGYLTKEVSQRMHNVVRFDREIFEDVILSLRVSNGAVHNRWSLLANAMKTVGFFSSNHLTEEEAYQCFTKGEKE